MSSSGNTTARQEAPPHGLIATLIALPFRLFGMLCGSLLLSILIECVGLHLFWQQQSWHHAQQMLHFELDQLSSYFKQSIVVQDPARTCQHAIERTYDALIVNSGVLDWVHRQSARAQAERGSTRNVPSLLRQVYLHLEAYALAVVYTFLTFLVRLMVLCLTAPLFFSAAFVGLVDGLVRRDIRRFGAGRESGFLYHRARATILPLVALPWVVYLALPVSVQPLLILLPSACLVCLAVNLAAGSFKKYL